MVFYAVKGCAVFNDFLVEILDLLVFTDLIFPMKKNFFSLSLHLTFFMCLCSVKIVRIQSFSGPYFPAFGLNTERYGVKATEETTMINFFFMLCLLFFSFFCRTNQNKRGFKLRAWVGFLVIFLSHRKETTCLFKRSRLVELKHFLWFANVVHWKNQNKDYLHKLKNEIVC